MRCHKPINPAFFLPALILFSTTAWSQSAPSAASESPMQAIKKTVDQVVETAGSLAGEANTTERRRKLRAIIEPRFDFDEMSKRSLGAYWQKITAEQQKEFMTLFSDLLAQTYLGRIESVKPGMVKVESENVDFPRAVVKTTVTNKGDTFPIDYKLLNMSGEWKVYDVVIENIGLVANYRNEFAGIIRKEEFSGLMKRLREKGGT